MNGEHGATIHTMLMLGSLLIAASACSRKEPSQRQAALASASAAAPAASAAAQPQAPSVEGCKACETSGVCADLAQGCSAFKDQDKAACEAVDACIDSSGCADGEKSFTSCFCGTLSTSDCLMAPEQGKGSPDGACRDVIAKAMGADELGTREVLQRFLKPEFPGGAAIARRNCQKGTGCATVCGF